MVQKYYKAFCGIADSYSEALDCTRRTQSRASE